MFKHLIAFTHTEKETITEKKLRNFIKGSNLSVSFKSYFTLRSKPKEFNKLKKCMYNVKQRTV